MPRGRKRKDIIYQSDFDQPEQDQQSGWRRYFGNMDFPESFISIVLGFMVIIVAGMLVFNYFAKGPTKQAAIAITPTPSPSVSVSGTPAVTAGVSVTAVPTSTPKPTITKAPTAAPTSTPKPTMTTAPSATAAPTKIAQATIKASITPMPTTVAAGSVPSTYTVAASDSLWKIAEKYYGSGYRWVDIARANNLTHPSHITVGQKLTMPQAGTNVAQNQDTSGKQVSSTSTVAEQKYTVVKGDSMWKIAVKVYGDGYQWTRIAAANKQTNPRLIHPGNVLTIPPSNN